MPENPNLQNEIDSILTKTNPGAAVNHPQTQTTQPQPTPAQTPTQQVPQQVAQPTITTSPTTTAPTNPVINNPQQHVTQNDFEGVITQNEKASSSSLFLVLAVIGFLLVLILFIYLMRKSIFGPLSFSDCAEIESSRVIELEPAYCVTQEGEIFYKNKNEELPEESEYVENFNPNSPPETILPNPQ